VTRVLVVGAGSAGDRHARLLTAAGADVTVTDPDPARTEAATHRTTSFDPDGWDDFDGIVLASPTRFHAEQARIALQTGARVLVEKPLAQSVADADDLAATADGRLMVGYNLRLHAPLERAVGAVHAGEIGTVRAARVWFGSWLPDWRPHVDYRQSYSARADLGGGVLLDAIHELDLLVWLFGDDRFSVVGAVVDRVGPLEIDVEDTVKAVLRHAGDATVEVSLDYLSRRYRRGMEIIGDDATVRLDWARRVIEVEDAEHVNTEPADDPVAASYERQAARFLAFVEGRAAPPVDGPTGAASVRLAAAIRGAAHRTA
jgi:predicted dehydrogenase